MLQIPPFLDKKFVKTKYVYYSALAFSLKRAFYG